MERQPREISDSRLAAPWRHRHDTAIPETGHDPYRERHQATEPAVCSDCHALLSGGKWTWGRPDGPASETVCPACRRIRDQFPAGLLTVAGQFLAAHRAEILNLVRNEADAERDEHPLNRIMDWEEDAGEVRITTTDLHTPRRIGEALRDAYHGSLEFTYLEDETLVRVRWAR